MLLLVSVGVLVGVLLVLILALAWRLRAVRTSEVRARARLAALLADEGAGLAVWDAGGGSPPATSASGSSFRR